MNMERSTGAAARVAAHTGHDAARGKGLAGADGLSGAPAGGFAAMLSALGADESDVPQAQGDAVLTLAAMGGGDGTSVPTAGLIVGDLSQDASTARATADAALPIQTAAASMADPATWVQVSAMNALPGTPERTEMQAGEAGSPPQGVDVGVRSVRHGPANLGTGMPVPADNAVAQRPLPDAPGQRVPQAVAQGGFNATDVFAASIANDQSVAGAREAGRAARDRKALEAGGVGGRVAELVVHRGAEFSGLPGLEELIKKFVFSSDRSDREATQARGGALNAVPPGSPMGGEGAVATQLGRAEAPPVLASASTLTEAPPPGLDTSVTEQMNYWVSREVQNAQIRLDGFGAQAVDVHISMHGKEAQIAFHTDMPEARLALEGATLQLKDMFTREGLVLSGVSVGTLAQGTLAQGQPDAQAQPGREPQASRQTRSVALPALADVGVVNTSRPAGQAGGRTLDLFV